MVKPLTGKLIIARKRARLENVYIKTIGNDEKCITSTDRVMT